MLRAELLLKEQQNQRLQKDLEKLRNMPSQANPQGTTPTSAQLIGAVAVAVDNNGSPLELSSRSHEHRPDEDEPHPMENFVKDISVLNRKFEKVVYQARQQAVLRERYEFFQARQRDVQIKKREVMLERYRRLLEQDPHVLDLADENEYTLEDQAATQVQRVVRGVQGRLYVKQLRPNLNRAAVIIQGVVRGHLGRFQVEVKKRFRYAVTDIQRVWRGHVGRVVIRTSRAKTEENKAAREIQRMVRGYRGRVRVKHKRVLRESAKRGADAVGIKQLFRQDIVQLANAIDTSLHREQTSSPPSIVLGLVRVVALMLAEDEESGAITSYSALGVQSIDKVQATQQYKWIDALRMLRRSSKLLRRLRQVAEGPASERPRMVHFSQVAVQTYHSLRCDREWNLVSFGRVGGGAKACQHLLLWVDALHEVFAYQLEFLEDLGSDRMSWFGRAQMNMRCMRHLELSRMAWEHGVTCLAKVLRDLRSGSRCGNEHSPLGSSGSRKGDLRGCVAERAMATLREHEARTRDALAIKRKEEEEAQRNDLARELFRTDTLVDELTHAESDVADKSRRLEEVKRAERDGIEVDKTHLHECLDDLAISEVARREHWTSLEMARVQGTRNARRRGVRVEVWGELRQQLQVVGETKAALVLAVEDHKNCLEESGSLEGLVPDTARKSELEALQLRVREAQERACAAQLCLDLLEEEKENAHATSTEAEVRNG